MGEKRGRNFDKVIGEWKAKVDDLSAEIEASQKECRNYNSELFRLKAAWDETTEQLDVVKRENKNLADEIKDLLDQLGDGGRSIHELDKQRRVLKLRRKNFKLLLRRLKLLWNKKKTRFSELNWNLDKFVKRLIGRSRKRKRSLTILERTTKEQWTPCKLLLKLNLEQRLRPSVSRKSLNLTSMN